MGRFGRCALWFPVYGLGLRSLEVYVKAHPDPDPELQALTLRPVQKTARPVAIRLWLSKTRDRPLQFARRGVYDATIWPPTTVITNAAGFAAAPVVFGFAVGTGAEWTPGSQLIPEGRGGYMFPLATG